MINPKISVLFCILSSLLKICFHNNVFGLTVALGKMYGFIISITFYHNQIGRHGIIVRHWSRFSSLYTLTNIPDINTGTEVTTYGPISRPSILGLFVDRDCQSSFYWPIWVSWIMLNISPHSQYAGNECVCRAIWWAIFCSLRHRLINVGFPLWTCFINGDSYTHVVASFKWTKVPFG